MSRLDSMSNRNEIITCWAPSHIGVRRNERADSATKSALGLTPDKSRIPYTDLKPTINKFLHTKWQQQWSNNIHNKQPWECGDQHQETQEENKSYKANSLFHFETGTTTTVFDLPDNLHGQTHSYRMQSFCCYQKAIFQSK